MERRGVPIAEQSRRGGGFCGGRGRQAREQASGAAERHHRWAQRWSSTSLVDVAAMPACGITPRSPAGGFCEGARRRAFAVHFEGFIRDGFHKQRA